MARDAFTGAFADVAGCLANGAGGYLTMGVANLAPIPAVIATAAGTIAITAVTNWIAAKDDDARKAQVYYLFKLDRKLS